MLRSRVKQLVLMTLLTAAALSATPAQAGWWYYRTSWFGCCRPVYVVPWYGGCDPCFNCCCGGCWDCCGGSYVVTDPCGCGTAPAAKPVQKASKPEPTSASKPAATMTLTSAATTPTAGTAPRTADDAVSLAVTVPLEATVYVNGVLTKSTGTQRRYLSQGLNPGQQYRFRVEVVRERDGRQWSDTQVVYAEPGESAELNFNPTGERVASR
jgi:uncharacterized protein (TIGR03000 family)